VTLRICFLADPTHPNTMRWVRHLAVQLGHEVWVLSGKAVARDTESNPRVLSFPVRTRMGYLALGLRARGTLRRVRPDLLVGYRVQSYGFAAALTGVRPLVLAAQTETIVWPPDNRLYRACARYALGRAALVQAWGRHMAERLEELGVERERILVLPRGVDVGTFHAGAAPIDAPVLVVSRSLRAVYRHDLLLRAFALLRRRLPEARLLVAGDGAEREALSRLAAELDLAAAVEFRGQLAEAALAEVYRSARCYVTTVATEGVSASLLEAMGCGLVPVVADLDGNREWIDDGDNGLLVPGSALDSPQAIAERLHRACVDAPLQRRAFETNPRRIAERADWAANMRVMEQRYRQIAGAA